MAAAIRVAMEDVKTAVVPADVAATRKLCLTVEVAADDTPEATEPRKVFQNWAGRVKLTYTPQTLTVESIPPPIRPKTWSDTPNHTTTPLHAQTSTSSPRVNRFLPTRVVTHFVFLVRDSAGETFNPFCSPWGMRQGRIERL